MSFDVAISLAGLSVPRAAAAERMLSLLPELAEGGLFPSDVAVDTSTASFVGVLRFALGMNAPLERARFWCARSGISWVPMSTMSAEDIEAFVGRFELCPVGRRDVGPADLARALREVFSALDVPPPSGARWPPVLSLDPNGPGWEGFVFQRDDARLFVPSALTPVVGDEVTVEMRTPEVLTCRAHVTSVGVLGDAVPGALSGFEVALDPLAEDVRAALAARCAAPNQFLSGRRAYPRFRVTARASVDAPGESNLLRGSIANVSEGGAFIRSKAATDRVAVGMPLETKFMVSDGVRISARATVVHANEKGFGIRFERNERVRGQLANLLAQLPGRSRRVLVVDDDALARRMLADAFAADGFEVLTASDAVGGLETLIDEIFTLDLLVTDVVMQGLDGVELLRRIRHDGNESDLPILAVTASLTPELKDHLLRAGADAVAMKSIGPRLLVLAAEDVLARRSSAHAAMAPASQARSSGEGQGDGGA